MIVIQAILHGKRTGQTMLDFCKTKAASAAAGDEKWWFCMKCEQRRATSAFESQQRTEYRYRDRSRASEGVTEGYA